ncbi:MAG: DUF6580 family putative transport protein [Akkermansiaceae bacterium]
MNRFLPLALFVILVVAFRWVGSAFPETLPNFSPLTAWFFCGAILCKDWKAWGIPLAAWLVTYPIPAFIAGNYGFLSPGILLATAAAFATVFFLGKAMSNAGLASILAGSVIAALTFHLITNGLAWVASPLYPKNLNGIIQSLWTGPVNSPIPSWVFLRNMAAANLLFTAIMLSARFALPKLSTSPAPQQVR